MQPHAEDVGWHFVADDIHEGVGRYILAVDGAVPSFADVAGGEDVLAPLAVDIHTVVGGLEAAEDGLEVVVQSVVVRGEGVGHEYLYDTGLEGYRVDGTAAVDVNDSEPVDAGFIGNDGRHGAAGVPFILHEGIAGIKHRRVAEAEGVAVGDECLWRRPYLDVDGVEGVTLVAAGFHNVVT